MGYCKQAAYYSGQTRGHVEHVRIGIWSVHCDVAATRRAYERIAEHPPAPCAGCRNLAALTADAYPADLCGLLHRLGIDPRFPAEVYWLGGPLDSGEHLYEGWYYFVGTLDEEIDALEHLDERTTLFFTGNSRALLPEAFREQPTVQLAFSIATMGSRRKH